MDKVEFKEFLKMLREIGITDYKIKDHHISFMNQSYVYMIVDKEPDYVDDENIQLIKDLMRDSQLPREPDLKEKKFHELLLTFNHISKYRKHVKQQVRFVIGNVANSIVIGHVDLRDNDIESETNIEILGKLVDSDKITSFDTGIMNNIISFIEFFKYSGTSSGFIRFRFREGMPLIIDKDRFRIYVAPIDHSDDLVILKRIKNSINGALKNISRFESEE
jgi:hypothetical protein